MQAPRPLLALLLLAACGSPSAAPPADGSLPDHDAADDDGGASADAADPDAAPPSDAGGAPDASPDGGPGEPLPPIERAQAGGETAAVAIAGHHAFVGVGPRLTVWDLSSGTPSRIGETDPLDGVVNGVAVSGDLALVVTGKYGDGRFHVIDVADPTSPGELAAVRLGTGTYSSPTAVAVDGTIAYVADAEQGVFRVDVAAPLAPAVTAFQPAFGATHVQVAGDRVHVAGVGFFGVAVATFDASNDLAPLGSSHLDGAVAAALTSDGLILTRGSGGFAVDDLANPAAPARIYTQPISAWAMVPGDGGAWLTVDGYLRFLDLGDHDAITLGPAHAVPVWAVRAAAFAGDRLAITTYQGGLEAFDVDGGAPSLLGRAPTGPGAFAYATAVVDEMLVIAGTSPGAVGTIGTADLAELAPVGQHVQLSAVFEDIAYAGGRAYVADWFLGLWAFDVTDPAHPFPSAYVPTGSYPSAIAAAPGRVYLGESTSGGALRVFSPDGTSDPVQLGAIATGQVADLAAVGELVYVAERPSSGPGGLHIYDTQDPSAIAPVGAAGACDGPRGVAVSGHLALLSCSDGVHVIDVTDPASPTTLAVWTPPAPSIGVLAFDGARGYHGDDRGVTVFDVTTPTAPTTIAELPTAWIVRQLTIAGPGRVVAATTRGGVYQWQL